MPTTVKILRTLWRLRAAVAVVLLVAIVAGTAVEFRISPLPPQLQSRRYEVGVANARVLVDTPTSDIIAVAPKGSDTLAARATLLANLMVDGVVEDAIAKRAGLNPDKLIGISGSADADPTAPKPGPKDYTLTTGVALDDSGDQLPIITISTQAPDVNGAARLANAAIAGLNAYLDSQAAVQNVRPDARLRVSGLGGAQAGSVMRGPSRVMALVVMLLIFCFGCAVLLGVHAVLRDWYAPEEEQAADEQEYVPEAEYMPEAEYIPEAEYTPKEEYAPEEEPLYADAPPVFEADPAVELLDDEPPTVDGAAPDDSSDQDWLAPQRR
jgi:capsular polysaccharide biosynthesis protein